MKAKTLSKKGKSGITFERNSGKKIRKQKNPLVQPFLKWAGGKRQLLTEIQKYIPKKYSKYHEPFLGGGALLFDLQPSKAVINDLNRELYNCYLVIKNKIEILIEDLKYHKNDEKYYYKIRELDRTDDYSSYTDVQKASRLLFLNKTCYNGLFRVNRNGQFNVPFGRYKKPNIVNEHVLRAISHYLNQNDVELTNKDFEQALSCAKKNDFIYLDPPYDPISDTSSFTGYNMYKFDRDEQYRLSQTFIELNNRGCLLLLSNSATSYIKELYKDFNIVPVFANRNINSNINKRGKIEELLIMNY